MSTSLTRMFSRAFIDSYKRRLKYKTYYRVTRFGYLAGMLDKRRMSTDFTAKNTSQQCRVHSIKLVITTEL